MSQDYKDIQSSIEEAKKIFLTDVDPDDLEDNLEIIRSWEKQLIESTDYEEWRKHDITKKIAHEAREAYKDATMQLGLRRGLTEEERIKLQGHQDACVFLLSLIDRNLENSLSSLNESVQRAIRTSG